VVPRVAHVQTIYPTKSGFGPLCYTGEIFGQRLGLKAFKDYRCMVYGAWIQGVGAG